MARRVAVFDDSASFRQMMRRALESEGYRVVTAPATWDTIRMCRPDLVILDMGLRRQLIALTILHDLRADPALAGLSVIVCATGKEHIEGQRRFLEALGAAILTKPFAVADLLRLVDATMRADHHDTPERECR